MGEVEEFLSHHGVKGMKWGVRKKKLRNARAKEAQRLADRARKTAEKRPIPLHIRNAQKRQAQADKLKRYAEGKQTTQDKVEKAANVATVILAGAFIASRLAASSRSVNSLPKTPSNSVSSIINAERNHQASSLKRMFEEGKMDQAQYSKFRETLHKRYDRKLMEAIGDL